MKKIVASVALLLLVPAMSFAATVVAAGSTFTGAGTLPIQGRVGSMAWSTIHTLSNGVTGKINWSAGASGNFAAQTFHLKGTKEFGTTNTSTTSFWQEPAGGVGSTFTASDSTAFSGWKTQ